MNKYNTMTGQTKNKRLAQQVANLLGLSVVKLRDGSYDYE